MKSLIVEIGFLIDLIICHEIRGIGILDIERLYGVGVVKQYEFIDLIF